MKTSRIIQFVVAAMLFSVGSVALLAGAPYAVSTICFGLPAVVLMSRAAATRPIPRQELLVGIVFLVILAAAVILLKLFVSDSVGQRLVRHPAFVIPLWVMMLLGLFCRLRRERRLTDA